MEYVLIFVATLIASAILRLIVILANIAWFRQGYVGDSSVHIEIIKQLKIDSHSIKIQKYLLPNTMSYPVGFHRLVRYLPIDIIEKYNWIPNLVIFSVFTAIYVVYVRYIELALLQEDGWEIILIVLFYFYLSISNLVFYGPAIAYIKLSERLLARMSCSLYFLSLTAWFIWADWISAVLSMIFCAITLVTSTFGVQVILFSTIVLSLLFLTISNIAIVLIGLVLSVLLSRGYILTSLIHTVRYWRIYKLFVKKGASQNAALSRYINPAVLISFLKQKKYGRAIGQCITKEPVRAMLFYPELLVLGILVPYIPVEISIQLVLVVISILILYLITSTEKLNHLGEAYRYIEYSLYMIFPIIAAIAYKHSPPWLFWFVSMFYAVYGVGSACVFYGVYMRRNSLPDSDKLLGFLKKAEIDEKSVVFPVSMRLGADVCARVGCKTFWWQPGGITEPAMYERYIEEYPFLKKDYAVFVKKYGVTHVVCEKAALSKINWQYDFSKLRKILEDDNYIAYIV